MILNLVSITTPFGDKCSLFHYRDENNRDFIFRDTNIPFQFLTQKGTDETFSEKESNKIIETYLRNGLDQHNYKGGYSEAVSKLIIK